jgi:hypothetical protein
MAIFIDPAKIDSAADSWSGFVYQGKVALYHVLKLLIEDTVSPSYHLQLDSLEDFAIVDGNIIPITLHQVKALKSHLYSSYKDAFIKQEERLVMYPCNAVFFHLATENEKTKAQIEAIHTTINIYEYKDGNAYCGLDNIDENIEELISEYFVNNILDEYNNQNYIQIVKNCLEDIIVGQIISIHACNHRRNGLRLNEAAYYFTIPFTKFTDLLHIDLNTKTADEVYYLNITKKLINNYYTEFALELEEELIDEGLELTGQQRLKLDNHLLEINSLNKAELISFIKNLIPHREFKLQTLFDFKDNNITQDEFKFSFLRCLFELIDPTFNIKEGLMWCYEDSKKYTATAIYTPQSDLKKICKKIYKNIIDNDFEIPYQSDYLITKDLEIDSIEKGLNNLIKIPVNDDVKNNITKWSNVGLVKIETAKNILG